MNVALVPFYSQQDKRRGREGFLFRSCGATRILGYAGRRLLDAGHSVAYAAPLMADWSDDLRLAVDRRAAIVHVKIPADNFRQRLEWPVGALAQQLRAFGADAVLCMHETLGWALKGATGLPLVQMYNTSPTGDPWPWMNPLIELSCRAADLVTCMSETMAGYVRSKYDPPARVAAWPLTFDASALDRAFRPTVKDVDVLFVVRGSASNYSHHREFFAAAASAPEVRVGVTDVTHYFKAHPEELAGVVPVFLPDPQSEAEYGAFLRRCRFAVAMNDNGHGSAGLREAAYCGAVPVTLGAPCYREFLGDDWPLYIREPTPRAIAAAVGAAMRVPPDTMTALRAQAWEAAARESFDAGWRRAAADLAALFPGEVFA